MLTKLDELLEQRAEDVARVKGIEATCQMMEQRLKGIEKAVKSFKDNQEEIVKDAVAAAVDPLSTQVKNLVDCVNTRYALTENSKATADAVAAMTAELVSLNARVDSLVVCVKDLYALKAEETRYRDEAKGSKRIADATVDDFCERLAIHMDSMMSSNSRS